METSIITIKNDENIVNYSVLDGICGAYKATIEEVEKAVYHLLKATEIIQNVGLAHSSYFLLNGGKNNLSYANSDKECALERMTEEIRQGVWESLYQKLPVNKFMTESVKKQVDALFKSDANPLS